MTGPASHATSDLIAWAEAKLGRVSDCARLEAELLLADCAGISRAAVMAWPERSIGPAEAARLAAVVARRRRGEPIAYITGSREFYSLPLGVDARVLVPRPETEQLVEAAIARIGRASMRVLDLGTGSGAIALAIKHERPGCEVLGSDRSPAALEVAQANAAALGLDVDFVESDWFARLADRQFDLIVSNPPYVATNDPHLKASLTAEPALALDGGADGLDAYRAILASANSHLAPGGALLLEHGHDQRAALTSLARRHGFGVAAALDDLAGVARVLVLEPETARP